MDLGKETVSVIKLAKFEIDLIKLKKMNLSKLHQYKIIIGFLSVKRTNFFLDDWSTPDKRLRRVYLLK